MTTVSKDMSRIDISELKKELNYQQATFVKLSVGILTDCHKIALNTVVTDVFFIKEDATTAAPSMQ
jgi:hypothetical protein